MQPTRRQVLRGGAVLTVSSLAACTPDRTPARPGPTPDDQLRAEAVARERALVEAYLVVLHAHPSLTGRLAPVLGDHSAHLAALDATPAASAAPSAVAQQPATAKAALAALVAQERAAAAAHAEAAVAAESAVTCGRTLSPVLASLAASEASHAAVLV